MREQVFLWIAVLAAVAATIACVCLAVRHQRAKKRIETLRKTINTFLNEGEAPDYSLQDDYFSPLENDVADLAKRVILEKENAQTLILENNAFLADISHQVKTPLAGLRLYTEMAQQTADETMQPSLAKQIALIERMETLIHNLLRLEKLRSDAYKMQFADEKLENICGEVLGEFRTLYPQKQFSLSGAACLRCDRQWMHEAIANVIKNACEHTLEDGEIRLQIEKSDCAVFLRIEDNGGGIADTEYDHIFDRFTRSPAAIKEGAGLGLAITRAIVQRHHASLLARNTKNGLCIEFCFPTVESALRNNLRHTEEKNNKE